MAGSRMLRVVQAVAYWIILLLLVSDSGPTFYISVGEAADGAGQHSRLKTQPFVPKLGPRVLQSMCQQSVFPAICMRELSPITVQSANTANYTSADVLELALHAALTRATQAQQLAARYSTDPQFQRLARQSAGDCVQFMGLAQQHLQAAVSLLSQLAANSTRISSSLFGDVKRHLSFCMSFQSACYDGLQDQDAADRERQLESNQEYLFEVIGNVMSLVDGLEVDSSLHMHSSYTSGVPHPATLMSSSNTRVLPRASNTRAAPAHRLAASILTSGANDWDDQNQGSSSKRASIMQDLNAINQYYSLPQWLSPSDRSLLQQLPAQVMDDVAPAPAPSSGDGDENNDANDKLLANAVVAQDGSGDFLTITEALNNIPAVFEGRYVIYIKAGVYAEVVNITGDQQNVTFLGDGMDQTIITGSRSVASGLYTTFNTATVGISGDGFFARDITFRNTAGPIGHQAVALRTSADLLVFYRCSFEGFQDTLYALSGRQFFHECQISGTVDFIFGYASAVFHDCTLLARLPMEKQKNTYTAQGRKLGSDINGFVFLNCTLAGEDALLNASFPVSTFLGRPWKEFSRVLFIESQMDALLDPQGWLSWNQSNPFITTLFYGEFHNRGPGSPVQGRVNWPGVHANMTFEEASQFSVDSFIQGPSWIPATLLGRPNITFGYNLLIGLPKGLRP